MARLVLRLASRSPRRRALLEEAGIAFETVDVLVDETPPPGLAPEAVAGELALRKARAGALLAPDALVLGSDTIVALGARMLGKPEDDADAREMLAALSGGTHQVFTGFACVHGGRTHVEVVTAHVTFAELDASRIAEYVATGEGRDKAGSYGIQGAAGAFVSRFEGSWTGIVGLPMERVSEVVPRLLEEWCDG